MGSIGGEAVYSIKSFETVPLRGCVSTEIKRDGGGAGGGGAQQGAGGGQEEDGSQGSDEKR